MTEKCPIEISDFLAKIEPFCYTVSGMPIKQISYSQRQIVIDIFTQRELDNLMIDWFDQDE